MKKIIMLLMLLVSLATANAKCDWSSLKLEQANDRNYYQWRLSGKVLEDTCVNWMFMIYDFQTKKTDTLLDDKGLTQIYPFYNKGKYKMYLKVWNRCKKCDTALYREVNIIYFPKCNFTYNLKSTKNDKCLDSMVGEMGVGPVLKGDVCWEWYSYIWHGPMLDSLSVLDWDSALIPDEKLYMYYDFDDSDLVWFKGPENSARIIKYKFPNEGRYLVATQWYNKCLDQDTVFFTRITIKCDKTSGITTIIKHEPKLIGMYDMMGRPVYHIRENEVLIYQYNDGTTRKILKTSK
jgi:hypothetical protein